MSSREATPSSSECGSRAGARRSRGCCRVGDRDLERVVLERVRDRADALEDVQRDQLRRVLVARLVARGRRAAWWMVRRPGGGDAARSRRLRDRRPGPPCPTSAGCERARARRGERPSASRSAGRARSPRAGRRGARESAFAPRSSVPAVRRLGRRIESVYPVVRVLCRRRLARRLAGASEELSASGSASLDEVRSTLERGLEAERRYASSSAAAEEQRDDASRRRGTGRTGSPSCAPSRRGGRGATTHGTSAATIPTISATATVRPSTAPSSSASLTSPIPIPAG